MKKYTRAQEVRAIQWTGDNKVEVEEALGYSFDVWKHFESDEKGYSLHIHKRGEREFDWVAKDDWIVLDKYAIALSKIEVVSNGDFQKEFVISKEKSDGADR